MMKVSLHTLAVGMGVWGRAKGLDFKLFHEQVGNEGADGGTHHSTMDLFVILSLEEEVSVLEANLQECDYLLYRHVGPL